MPLTWYRQKKPYGWKRLILSSCDIALKYWLESYGLVGEPSIEFLLE